MIDRETHRRKVVAFAKASHAAGLRVGIRETRRTSSGFATEIAESDRVRVEVIGATAFVSRRSWPLTTRRTRNPDNLWRAVRDVASEGRTKP